MISSEKNVAKLFTYIAAIFCVILLLFSAITVHSTYNDKRSRILSSMEMVSSYADQEYSNIISNFWQAYIPFYEASSADQLIVNQFFAGAKPMTPLMKNQLSLLLERICMRDNRIAWVALYAPQREESYIQYYGSNSLSVLPEDFPWMDDLENKKERMEVYGLHRITNRQIDAETFAIAGGVPLSIGQGSVLIGYRTATIDMAKRLFADNVETMACYITSGDQIIYHSGNDYEAAALYFPDEAREGVYTVNGRSAYVMSSLSGLSSSYLVCLVDQADLLRASHKHTPLLVMITMAFFAFSLLIYRLVHLRVAHEVSVIKEGLNILSANNLEYRLPLDFRQSAFREIAENINNMSSLLDESIRKAYYFELKQKDAEMAELQATFNPHFLYNTLEMLRSKAYGNGDEDTAALIADLASIFRSFIGAKTCVSLREELASCTKYLKLLAARYGDVVDFRFDIDSELLRYGIIRNVFQLLVENYFVHGLDTSRTDNAITFVGRSEGETDMILQVVDNGYGMTPEAVDELNREIERPIRHSHENFGLKNLHQRLKLFYGPDYGLHIIRNESGGITVDIRIRKITVEEYEAIRVKLDADKGGRDNGL